MNRKVGHEDKKFRDFERKETKMLEMKILVNQINNVKYPNRLHKTGKKNIEEEKTKEILHSSNHKKAWQQLSIILGHD